ncbi:tyrosine kinase receptor Cad96Ca [Biomphalaria glabrata]|nr:tyrosine kinase receptor Cad96Ca [Biomphalaria glabrata]
MNVIMTVGWTWWTLSVVVSILSPSTAQPSNMTNFCNVTWNPNYTLQCMPSRQIDLLGVKEVYWLKYSKDCSCPNFTQNSTWPSNFLDISNDIIPLSNTSKEKPNISYSNCSTTYNQSCSNFTILFNYTCTLTYENGSSMNVTCHFMPNVTNTSTQYFEETNSKAFFQYDKSTMSISMTTFATSLSTENFSARTGHTTEDDQTPSDHENSHLSTIVWIVLGIVIGFGLLSALGLYLFKKRRKMSERHRQVMSTHPALPPGHHPSVTIFTNWKNTDQKPNPLEEIPRKNIVFLQTIGKGMFGTVAKADVLNINNVKGCGAKRWTTAAIKMTLIADRVHEDAKADFLAELTLMKSIPPHPNIIKMYGSCTAHDPYLMILEFACHGDLKKYLQDQRMERNYANAAFSAYGVRPVTDATTTQLPLGVINQGYTESVNERYVTMSKGGLLTSRTLLSFALQIGHGLEHLADTKIVHRDVAARNILLFEHNVVKISDFGLARRVGQGDVYERTRKGLLPVRWMSPESLFYNQYSQASDVWSYGVFLWELVTLGSTPYPGLDTNQVLDKIKDGELLTCPPHTSDVINDLMLSCWTSDFSKRPTFSEVCAKLDKLLEAQVEYVDLDQMDDHEYSTLND